MAAEPQTIGNTPNLVYCMACGFLLSSDDGPTSRREKSCTPIRIGLR